MKIEKSGRIKMGFCCTHAVFGICYLETKLEIMRLNERSRRYFDEISSNF